MDNELLQFPAELISYKTYQTKQELQVSFELQELAAPDLAKLISCKGQTGYLVFSPSRHVNPADIPKQEIKEKAGKTPSERLYNILFVYWKHLGLTMDFNTYYNQYMETAIQSIKDKLPPRE